VCCEEKSVSLLVTGGHGFVMSHLVRTWAQRHQNERIIVLDREPAQAMVQRFFSPAADRLTFLKADIVDRASWFDAARTLDVDKIVHGAALTPHAYIDEHGIRHDPERDDPEAILTVNLGGTLAVLAFARALPGCRRFVLVSTGSVYGDDGPNDRPLPEEGYVAPGSLYGISKYAAELVAQRFASLYRLPVITARLASVYGPMDRLLPSRHVICAPNRMTALALAGETIRINSPDAVGDFVHAADVASALAALVDSTRPGFSVYNIGSGRVETLAHLAELITSLVPGAKWCVDGERPNVVGDPTRRSGQWGAYDTSRIVNEFGWSPRSITRRLADYIAWRRTEEAFARGHP
jgi:UDP-glucose 4-epimerase